VQRLKVCIERAHNTGNYIGAANVVKRLVNLFRGFVQEKFRVWLIKSLEGDGS